jgi:hypothetical protein
LRLGSLDNRPSTTWVQKTTNCKEIRSIAPEDGQKIARNMLSFLNISKSSLLHLVGLIKDARSNKYQVCIFFNCITHLEYIDFHCQSNTVVVEYCTIREANMLSINIPAL